MPPAARITDMHTCPMVTGPVPHVGGPILPPGALTVLINDLPAATVSNMCTCVGPPDTIVQGSPTVLINYLPAARMGDMTAHGGVIVIGSPTVMIGESGGGAPGLEGPGGIVTGAEGFQNQQWSNINQTDFKTIAPPSFDLEHLTPEQKQIKKFLENQGRPDKEIKQVMESGTEYRLVEMKQGDSIGGFTSTGYPKSGNSAYWMSGDQFQRMADKHYSDGVWDRQAVKNELALPCMNRADAVSTTKLTKDCTVLESKINPATENTFYTRPSSSETVQVHSIMPGGEKQYTPPADALGNIQTRKL